MIKTYSLVFKIIDSTIHMFMANLKVGGYLAGSLIRFERSVGNSAFSVIDTSLCYVWLL